MTGIDELLNDVLASTSDEEEAAYQGLELVEA